MLNVKTETSNHHIEAFKKLMVTVEYILSECLEDNFVQFLVALESDSGWMEFQDIIKALKSEFEITEEEIVSSLFKAKIPAS